MSAYDAKENKFHSVCKVGTGFNQEELEKLTENLNSSLINTPKDNYVIPNKLKPDGYFNPDQVWEIGFDKFSESNIYLTYLNRKLFKGVSLRFPRFIRIRKGSKAFE